MRLMLPVSCPPVKKLSHFGDSIKQKFLTKELIEKVDRLIEVTDADPIIRAQDLSENDMKTLVGETSE